MRSGEHSAANIPPFICCYRIMAGSFQPSVGAHPSYVVILKQCKSDHEAYDAFTVNVKPCAIAVI